MATPDLTFEQDGKTWHLIRCQGCGTPVDGRTFLAQPEAPAAFPDGLPQLVYTDDRGMALFVCQACLAQVQVPDGVD